MGILEEIVSYKRTEEREFFSGFSDLELERQASAAPPPRDFAGALQACMATGEFAVVAELKRASPSKGIICENYDPLKIARSYKENGATCLSVLTDRRFFEGEDAHLELVRQVGLPIIRKDFMLTARQIVHSRALGADAILLIAAALAPSEMAELESVAIGLGMSVVAEIHNQAELDTALRLKTPLIGINNRDLHTFEVSFDVTETLAPIAHDAKKFVIAESGITSCNDLQRLRVAGADAFLVGERLMSATDPGQALLNLLQSNSQNAP